MQLLLGPSFIYEFKFWDSLMLLFGRKYELFAEKK